MADSLAFLGGHSARVFPCPFTFMPKEFWQKESLV